METNIKYAIVEDNPFAAEHLRMMIRKIRPEWKEIFTAKSVAKTIEYLNDKPDIDIIFLDIELNDGKCFKIFDTIHCTIPIIFTTAYDEFAIKAFKVNGVDYLLKPITPKDLSFAIDKFEHSYALRKPKEPIAIVSDISSDRLLTVSGDKYNYIALDDVRFFISEDNYAFAELKCGGRKLLNISNLGEIEKLLPPTRFFRVSRNIIASIDCIHSTSKFLRGRLLLRLDSSEGEIEVTVSASRREEFLHWLGR